MMLAHALVAFLAVANPPDSLLSADSLLVALRAGGYTIVWRHGVTDRSVQEPMAYETTPRFQQRNLTDRGIADAKAVGILFKSRGIPIGEVLSSPMFRTRETAEYAFGHVESTPLLRRVDTSPEQLRLIAAEPAAGTNRVLVTHHFVIEHNVPGIKPGQIAEGEAVVVRATGGNGLRTIGIFKMADWQRLSARMEKAPALLEAPQNAAIAEYLKTFNSGDATRMRQFYERFVVPNPARTMDERMEVYDQIKGDLGTLSIVSAEPVEANRVAVKAQSSVGPPATITFTTEAVAPYRLVTISFQIGGH